jgi:hypothetical protein
VNTTATLSWNGLGDVERRTIEDGGKGAGRADKGAQRTFVWVESVMGQERIGPSSASKITA